MSRSRFAPPVVPGPSGASIPIEGRRRRGTYQRLELGTPPTPAPAPGPDPQEQAQLAALEEARREGYARGLQEGRTQAEAEAEARLQTLAGHVEALASLRAVMAEAYRQELLELAIAAAEALVQRELSQAPQILHNLIEQGLAVLGRGDALSLHLHPDDAPKIRPLLERSAAAGYDVSVLEDASLSPGDLRLDGPAGTVQSVLHDRVARLRQLVVGALDGGEDAPREAE